MGADETAREFGARIMEKVRGLERIRAMVRHHHEFFDGSGYPHGLPAKIFLWARGSSPLPTPMTRSLRIAPTNAPASAGSAGRNGTLRRGSQFDAELVTVFLGTMRCAAHPPAAELSHLRHRMNLSKFPQLILLLNF